MTYLDKIIERKEQELLQRPIRRSLGDVLRNTPFTIIAEIKRGSPSKGILANIEAPEYLAKTYVEGGAGVLSVLTDQEFYASLDDLERVARSIPKLPIIRKDFVIDPIQVAEAAAAGASAVLLIVKVLGERTKQFIQLASQLGLDALVEVHDERELQVAIDAGAEIIGVNNRDLTSFTVDLSISEKLSTIIPKGILKVSESGISTKNDIERLKNCGYQAALIGESLVTAVCPQRKIKELLA